MSLDIDLIEIRPVCVFSCNITNNLTKMANDAGIYNYIWQPAATGIMKAKQLIEPLESGLKLLKSDPERFKKFNPENGWGDYGNFVEFVRSYFEACKANPEADIVASG